MILITRGKLLISPVTTLLIKRQSYSRTRILPARYKKTSQVAKCIKEVESLKYQVSELQDEAKSQRIVSQEPSEEQKTRECMKKTSLYAAAFMFISGVYVYGKERGSKE